MVIITITASRVVVEIILTTLSAMTSLLSAIWVHAIVTIGSIGKPTNIIML